MEDKDKKSMTKEEKAQMTFGYALNQECENFAVGQMLESDFILLSDANFKETAGIRVTRGEERQLQTIKRSSEEKYLNFYDQKLSDMINKFIKSNA